MRSDYSIVPNSLITYYVFDKTTDRVVNTIYATDWEDAREKFNERYSLLIEVAP